MALLGLALTVLAMLVVGLVLFGALCRLAGAGPDFFPQPRDRLMLGPLPGLALVALLVTILSLLHLVRAWVMAPLALAILIGLRRDTADVWGAVKDAAAATMKAARAGDLFPLASLVVGAAVTYVGLFLCFIPASNVDVWFYHIPLARSVASHAGFTYPQIGHLFYASQPFALEMFHGAGMVFFGHFAVASAINLAVYLSLAVLTVACVPRARGFLFLLLCYLFMVRLELQSAASPMIDTPRACLSIAAFLFAWRYAWTFRRLDLILSALVAGFAVAAKTTELVNVLIICATLAPFIWRRGSWRDLIPTAGIFTVVSSYWYIKNLVLYGNPVFPFFFGHPGLSDGWMRDLMLEMTRPFDVADRVYSTNLLTAQGWRDFFVVMAAKFFWLKWPALVALLGLALPWPRRWMLPLWSALLFLFWYGRMFNHIRWAITAVLLLTLTAFLVVGFAVNHLVGAWRGQGPLAPWLGRLRKPVVLRALPAALSAACLAFLAFVIVHVAQGNDRHFTPHWMDRNLVTALTRSGDPEQYLSQTREGFELYRYIGRHDLVHVFQPYDNGGALYASAYNDGRPNRWVVHFSKMPASLAQADRFIAREGIRYFIRKPLDPTDLERLGPKHVALANQMIERLRPHSRLILRDRFGQELYEILPGARIGAADRKGASGS